MPLFFVFTLLCTPSWATFWRQPATDNQVLQHWTGPATAVSEGPIRLLLWNVQKMSDPRWARDFLQISSDRNVWMLQEVMSNSEAAISQTIPFFWMAASFIYLNSGLMTGVGLGADEPLSWVQASRSPDVEPVLLTPKMSVSAQKGSVLLMSLHAINFREARTLRNQLAEWDATLIQHRGPVVIGGDFNTWSRAREKVFTRWAKKHSLSYLYSAAESIDQVLWRGCKLIASRKLHHITSSDHSPISADLDCSLSESKRP